MGFCIIILEVRSGIHMLYKKVRNPGVWVCVYVCVFGDDREEITAIFHILYYQIQPGKGICYLTDMFP